MFLHTKYGTRALCSKEESKTAHRTNKMAEWVKVFVAQVWLLKFDPWNPWWKKEPNSKNRTLNFTLNAMAHTHPHTHMYTKVSWKEKDYVCEYWDFTEGFSFSVSQSQTYWVALHIVWTKEVWKEETWTWKNFERSFLLSCPLCGLNTSCL